MTPTTAIILAGGAIDAAWQQQTGARTRAEVPVGDAPMYLHVVRALRQVDAIGDILLIGDAPAGEGYTTLPPRDSLLENVRLGLERSPTDSVLFATVDLPFLTPESVRFFLQESLASGAALTYAVVPADLCRERFPQLKRTTVRLREGELTGGNLFWAQRAVALRELHRLEALYRARKQPVRLALQIGVGLLIRFLLAQYLCAAPAKPRAHRTARRPHPARARQSHPDPLPRSRHRHRPPRTLAGGAIPLNLSPARADNR
jgi:GTP:adenosylcobinamide-phosphate guanylyltransferase